MQRHRKAVNAFGGQTLALAAIVIALVALINQMGANSAQDQVNQANANAAMRQIADHISLYPQAGHGKNFVLVIAIRSYGLIRDVEFKMPQPIQGCSAKCDWVAYDWFTLPNVPPCSIAVTTAFNDFRDPANPSKPQVGMSSMNGSNLDFTDPNGNSWALFSGESRLDLLAGYKAPTAFSWGGFATVEPASGCS